MKQIQRCLLATSVVATLAACGGGGGGGDSSIVEVPFSSFAAVTPNQTVVMDATARTSTVTYTTDAFGNITVIAATMTPAEVAGTMRLTYDGSRALSGISINTPSSNVSFSQGTSGHSVSCGSATCLAENPNSSAVIADPYDPALGWNYQTFGVWGTDISVGNSVFGALSAGNVTPGTAIPPTGNATFSGITAGFYVNTSGTPFATSSTMTADVDFSNQSIAFSTSEMTLVNVNDGSIATPAGLRFTGTLTYAPGVNNFSGPVTTDNGLLGGTTSGRFYGPAAEEMGGTYELSGTGVHRMIGGFGAKR